MSSAPSSGPTETPGQRAPAAILASEVAGFSARTEADEKGTLAALARDFVLMRALSEQHAGQVIKTTGDRLLCIFTTAVGAVSAALAMQRHLSEQAIGAPESQVLRHRIGVHLGDVVQEESDVTGDGVNVASLLQGEAEPGGICITQTVYDVVKDKLDLNAVPLGARELDNLSRPVPVYRILLEAAPSSSTSAATIPVGAAKQGQPPGASASPPSASHSGDGSAHDAPTRPSIVLAGAAPPRPAPPAQPPESTAPAPRRRRLAVLAGLGVVALVVLAMIGSTKLDHLRELDDTMPNEGPYALPSGGDATTPHGGQSGRRALALHLREQFLPTYDFAGLKSALIAQPAGSGPGSRLRQNFIDASDHLIALSAWLDATLAARTRLTPLDQEASPDGAIPAHRWFSDAGRVFVVEEGRERETKWRAEPPATVGALVVAALRDTDHHYPAAVSEGAAAFARSYDLPEMGVALGKLGIEVNMRPTR